MAENDLPTAADIKSPDYRAKCLEWALQVHLRDHQTPDKIVETAKAFHKYVYEGK